jgi:hypothetical protein
MDHDLHLTPEQSCPGCGEALSGSGDAYARDLAPPADGDLTVCIYCGTVLVYDADLALRILAAEEIDTLSPAELEQIWTLQRTMEALRRQYPPKKPPVDESARIRRVWAFITPPDEEPQ